jgi:murein hydrolase activator
MCLKPSNSRYLRIMKKWINLHVKIKQRYQQLASNLKLDASLFCLNIMYKTLITSVLLLLFSLNTYAQKRENLEAKRQQLLRQMEVTSLQYNQTKQSQTATRDRLESLQNQIETRESLVNTLHLEIDETEEIIARTEDVLNSLNDDIQRLRVEYASMMHRAYKSKMPNNALLYMLSANNFGEAYKKWQYFRQYDKYRKRQARLISETQKALLSKNFLLETERQQKTKLAMTNEQQSQLLVNEKADKDRLIATLKDEGNRLAGELKSQERKSQQINSAIENLIVAELEAKRRAAEERARKAREATERLAAQKTKTDRKRKKQEVIAASVEERAVEKSKKERVLTESSEDLALSSDFRGNKGKLPSPALGNIVRGFGRQNVVDRVTAINNGIDIRTAPNAEVRAVFGGTVSIVSSIAGLGNIVLVQHGNYYTVYSNLSSVSVKKGDTVWIHQIVGRAGENPTTKEPEVHFEVWMEKTHLNPTSWLAK